MNITIKEKVYGAFYGYAIGDAFGLGTEFMSLNEVKRKYPQGLTHFSQIVRDAHRSQWERGDYTNDTRIFGMLIESIINRETIDPLHFSQSLAEWYKTGPMDLTTNMRWVISQPTFAADPFETAKEVWKKMNASESPSDGLGRALAVGMWDENIEENAKSICRLTHPTRRCETNSLIIATMANSLMWHDEEASYQTLAEIARKGDAESLKYLEIARHGTLSDLHLDNENTFWYVRKAMAAALWCVWHCKSPNEALIKVTNEGGDADTNSSLAMGLIGLKYGFSSIDKEYVDSLIHKERVESMAERFTKLLTEKFGDRQ